MPPPPTGPAFTPKQGQYLAFIYAYTRVLGRPPAEVDLRRYFGVSPTLRPPMVPALERDGLIRRQPGVPGQHRSPSRSRTAPDPTQTGQAERTEEGQATTTAA